MNSRAEKEKRLQDLLAIDGVSQGVMMGMATPKVASYVREAKQLMQELGRT